MTSTRPREPMNQDAMPLTMLTTIERSDGRPEPADVKAGQQERDQPEHGGVDDQQEQPDVNSSAGSDSTSGDGTHDGVHHA